MSSGNAITVEITSRYRPARRGLECLDTVLLTETLLATIAVVLAIMFLASHSVSIAGWLVAPGILVCGAAVPTIIAKRRLSDIGLAGVEIGPSAVALSWACLATLPATFCLLWLLRSCHVTLPFRPLTPASGDLAGVLFYQFMYVAVAEELFFRGYLQGNILMLTKTAIPRRPVLQQWTTVLIASACFALAHILIQGTIISALTFLPGIVFGWLYIKTGSLLAPIVFHGVANIFYYYAVAIFT